MRTYKEIEIDQRRVQILNVIEARIIWCYDNLAKLSLRLLYEWLILILSNLSLISDSDFELLKMMFVVSSHHFIFNQ